MLTHRYGIRQPKTIEKTDRRHPSKLQSHHTKHKHSNTSPDITTASADLHDCTSWKTIHSPTLDHLPLLTTLSIHHKTKTTRSHFTKTITNYQKANWTSFKQHVKNLIPCRPHRTNVHEANKHLIKAILDADRLFIPKGNYNNTNHTHLSMHICKLIHHRNHIHKQNRSDPQIITLDNHINKQIHEQKTVTWKQHWTKLITNTIHTPCGAP